MAKETTAKDEGIASRRCLVIYAAARVEAEEVVAKEAQAAHVEAEILIEGAEAARLEAEPVQAVAAGELTPCMRLIATDIQILI